MKKKPYSEWKKINDLTNFAYKKSRKSKFKVLFLFIVFSLFIFSFAGITIFFSYFLLSDNIFAENTPKINIPKFSWDDLDFKMYDTKNSIRYNTVLNLFNSKRQSLLNDNMWIKIFFRLNGLSADDINWYFYSDVNYSNQVNNDDIQYFTYDGLKKIFVQLRVDKINLVLDLGPETFVINGSEIFYDNFFLWKQYVKPYDDLNGIYNSSYVPENLYTGNMQVNNFDTKNKQLVDYVSSRLDQFLVDEKQETTDKLNIKPIITADKIPVFLWLNDKIKLEESVKNLQYWFKNNHQILYDQDLNDFDLSKDKVIYITYFPSYFNVNDFINFSGDPLQYFDNDYESLKPIYEFQSLLKPDKDIPDVVCHYYKNNSSSDIVEDQDEFEKSLYIDYVKKELLNINNKDKFYLQDWLLDYAYKTLINSVEKSYHFLLPDKKGTEILREYYNIQNQNDLKNKLWMLSTDRDFNKKISINEITTDNIKNIRSIYFDLHFDFGFSFNWNGVINFYETNDRSYINY